MNGQQRNGGRKNNQQNKAKNADKTKNEQMKTETGCKKQGQQSGGKKRVKTKVVTTLIPDKMLEDLPVPDPPHLAVLSNFLNTISTEHGMSKADITLRWQIFNDVKNVFEKEIEGCSLRLYGSSKSCFGLKSSDINIDAHEENEEKIPKRFIAFLNVLKGCKQYCDVKEEFESKWPVINFKDVNSGLTCRVSTGNDFAYFTNLLLNIYGRLDSRVKPLCRGFRLWAKICKVDRQTAGTLPPYSFFLMVIHYLQQIEPPVLPAIHEMFGDKLTKYFEQEDSSLLADVQKVWKTKNKSCIGKLWLGLLRFYCNYEKNETFVVNIRQRKRLTRMDKSWTKKKFAIEDPFSTKRNVARTLLKTQAYRYLIEHLKVALVYFSRHPDSPITGADQLKGNKGSRPDQLNHGKNIHSSNASQREIRPQTSIDENAEVASSDEDEHDDDDDDGIDDGNGAGDDETRDRNDIEDLTDGVFAMDNINDSVISDNDGADTTATDQSFLNESSCPYEVAENTSLSPVVSNKVSPDTTKCSTVSSELPVVSWEKAEYLFDHSVLRKGPALETKCTYCGDEDHIVDNCTAEQVTRTLKPLPNVPDWFKDVLTKVCYCCRDDFGITKEQVEKRHFYLRALEAYITKFMQDARLHLFGSSTSGFGFTSSDIDLCMTLAGKTKNDVDCIEMITWLASILRKNPECANVIAITGAKVPIVKFFLRHANVEADISMYNEVALSNTKLLAAYVRIDKRVHVLGCILKIFVKICDIGDASRGSLSSYAYILMLLHFLQQRNPPVLPVLQELYHTAEQPRNIIEGHNCWFYNDLENLGSEWTARNTESCGELWLGFLRYYTEEFDYRRNVVCIRYLKPLTKFEKLWNGRQICIEDPFVLSHNLGAALTLGMVRFIRSTFEKARERFGTARRDLPADSQERQRFFFDTRFLNDGHLPPTGRNCNVCGKIGHWAKECPFRRDKSGKKHQSKGERSQQNRKEQGQQRSTEKGEQNKDEKFLKNVSGNTPQNNTPKSTKDNVGGTPHDNAGKSPQTINVKNQRAERNQAKEVGKCLQEKEDTPKLVQNPVAVEAVAMNAKTPGNTTDHQETVHPVLIQQTIPPPLLSKQGELLRPSPHTSIKINSPPRTWTYQPLSPPISPGNPMAAISSMQPPSPMSNLPYQGHMLPIKHLAYQQHGVVHGNTVPGSPPIQHPSPIRTPIPSLMRPYPSNPFNMSHPQMCSEIGPQIRTVPRTPPQSEAAPMSPIRTPIAHLMRPHSFIPMTTNHQTMLSEVSSQMGTIPGTPPQSGTLPNAQFFGGPGNPFAFNFFPGDMFLNKSPPLYQPFRAPTQPLQSPQHGPLNSVRIISCEDLEKGDVHVQYLERDRTDGVPRTPVYDTSSSGKVEKVPNKDFSPSVLEGLRALNVGDLHVAAHTGGNDQNVGAKQQEAKCGSTAARMKDKSDDITYRNNASLDFKPPPNVQNVAVTSPNSNEKDIVADRGEGFIVKAEHSEVVTGQKSKNRPRKNRSRKEEQIQGVKDPANFTENVPPLKDFLAALSLQAQQQLQIENIAIEQDKAKTLPQCNKLSPQQTQGHQLKDKPEGINKKPNRQADRQKQPNGVQHAQNQVQQLQQKEREQRQQHYTRQPKTTKPPTNKEKPNQELQQQTLKQEQTEPRHRKPRQYRNQRQPPCNSSPQQYNQFASQQHSVHPQQALQQMPTQIQHQEHNVCKEKTPTKDAVNNLIVKVQGDQREVSAQGSQNVNNTNHSRNRRRRRKPRNGGNRDDS